MDPFDASLKLAPTTLLGPLEQQIHHAVWMRGSGTVREVLQDPGIWQRYSTILTTMDRLFRKDCWAASLKERHTGIGFAAVLRNCNAAQL